MNKWISEALALGFTAAVPLDPAILQVYPGVRDMCAENRCRAYGKNWTCPPECGTLEECGARISHYRTGLLLQTKGVLEDSFDFEGMMELEEQHLSHFQALCEKVRIQDPDALCLGTGGCRICKQCAYPDPCRFPNQAVSSMEAYGLLVSDVCKQCGIPYYYGQNTLVYTACVLFTNPAFAE